MMLPMQGMLLFTLSVVFLFQLESQAGVFATVEHPGPGGSAIGLEPEFIIATNSSLGINARYQHGISDLMFATGIIGTGGGPRNFRMGGNLVFDFFPDIEGQPGVGLATQALYYVGTPKNFLEISAIPYLHKAFVGEEKNEIHPYVAFPLGTNFSSDSTYKLFIQAVLGGIFGAGGKLDYIAEIGIGISNSDSYISGGINYHF